MKIRGYLTIHAALLGFTSFVIFHAPAFGLTSSICKPKGKVINVLASGQSNMSLTGRSDGWDVPNNLSVWDWRKQYGETVGSGFVPASPFRTNFPTQFAAEIARQYADRKVYLTLLAQGSISIKSWLDDDVQPNLWRIMKLNVPAALQHANQDSFDVFLWWQGERDAKEPSGWYTANFEKLLGKLQTEHWIRSDTSIVIFSPNGRRPKYSAIQSELGEIAHADLANRKMIVLDQFNFSANGVHLDSKEYPAAAAYAAREIAQSCGSQR